jgi:glycosyltransferase involved in cell wall biosynthesis
MPVHNGERFLAHAMNSILTQSLANLELIVVDDGSTDATGSIIEGYVREDERVQPIHQPHLGVVSARNTGCFASRAPLLAMLDSDDIASRDRLAIQVDFLEHNKQVALLGGSALVIEETGRELGVLRYPTAAEGLSAQLHSYNCILR